MLSLGSNSGADQTARSTSARHLPIHLRDVALPAVVASESHDVPGLRLRWSAVSDDSKVHGPGCVFQGRALQSTRTQTLGISWNTFGIIWDNDTVYIWGA